MMGRQGLNRPSSGRWIGAGLGSRSHLLHWRLGIHRKTLPDPLLIRVSIALVWLYEGLWCKLLGRAPHQKSVVGSVPFFEARFAHFFLMTIGAVECAFGVWTLAGWQLWWAALAQTAFLATLNAGGILWARRIIHDPAGMVVKNFVFVILMWVAAAQPSP